eukprot:scaffold145623_cov27-Tisochrysis_lutea.AAC.2
MRITVSAHTPLEFELAGARLRKEDIVEAFIVHLGPIPPHLVHDRLNAPRGNLCVDLRLVGVQVVKNAKGGLCGSTKHKLGRSRSKTIANRRGLFAYQCGSNFAKRLCSPHFWPHCGEVENCCGSRTHRLYQLKAFEVIEPAVSWAVSPSPLLAHPPTIYDEAN